MKLITFFESDELKCFKSSLIKFDQLVVRPHVSVCMKRSIKSKV